VLITPVDWSLNATVRGAFPVVGVAENLATGVLTSEKGDIAPSFPPHEIRRERNNIPKIPE